MKGVDAVIDQGLAAVEQEDLEGALAALEEAQKLVGENHVRVLHLNGLIAWAEGRLQNAAGYLQQAVDMRADHPEIYLDCAECLAAGDGENYEAESVLRSLLAREGAPPEALDQAHLLLAQLRLEDDDVEEALEELDAISDARKGDPVYLSTRAMVLTAGDRDDEALEALGKAVELDPEDPDYHYQLGMLQERRGEHEAARASLLRVLELDGAEGDEAGYKPLTPKETDALRARFEEDILTELPDPVLETIANAPVTVQRRATAEQVQGGVNPRSPVAFLGRGVRRGGPKLEGIVIMRDMLLDAVDDEDDLVPLMLFGLLEELRGFFGMDDLHMVSAN